MVAVGSRVGVRVGSRVGVTMGRASSADPVDSLIASLSPRAWWTFDPLYATLNPTSDRFLSLTDRTGNGHTQTTSVTDSLRPMYSPEGWLGGPCGAFSGSEYTTITSGTVTTLPNSSAAWSLLWVGVAPPSGTSQCLAAWGDTAVTTRRIRLVTTVTTDTIGVQSNGAYTVGPAVTGNRVIYVARQGSTTGNVDLFLNGTKVIDNAALTYYASFNNFTIGAFQNSAGISANLLPGGLVKHCAVFPANLSDADVATIQTQLGSLVA